MQFPKRESVSGGASKDAYLKFQDGESKHVVLRGEVFQFFIKWVNNKSVPTSGNDPEAKPRYTVNAVLWDGKEFKAKIWDFSQTVCNMLSDIHGEYPIDQTKIKITRQGKGTDTEYHILPILGEKGITKAQLAEIAKVDLHILNAKSKEPSPANGWDGNAPMPDFPPEAFESHDEPLPF